LAERLRQLDDFKSAGSVSERFALRILPDITPIIVLRGRCTLILFVGIDQRACRQRQRIHHVIGRQQFVIFTRTPS